MVGFSSRPTFDTSSSVTFDSGGTLAFEQDAGNGAAMDGLEGGGSTDFLAFVDAVYAEAGRRLAANRQSVVLWQDFVATQMTDLELEAQVFATSALDLYGRAVAAGRLDLFDAWARTRDSSYRRMLEHQLDGEWQACTGCHMGTQEDDVPDTFTVTEELAGLAFATAGTAWGPVLEDAFFDPASAVQQAILSGSSHTDVVLAAVALIRPYLAPLGPEGYAILPETAVSDYATPGADGAAVRAVMDEAFAARLAGYDEAATAVANRSVDWLRFEPILAELLPTASPEVQASVAQLRTVQDIAEVVTFASMLLLDLLSIVFPPLAIVAGAAHIVHGGAAMAEGDFLNDATGADDVVSPEDQAQADLLWAGGLLEVANGMLQLGQGIQAASADAALAQQGSALLRQGSVTVEVYPDGLIVITDAARPGAMIHVRGGVARFYQDMGNGTLMLLGEAPFTAQPGTTMLLGAGGSTFDGATAVTGLAPQLRSAGLDLAVLDDATVDAIWEANGLFARGQLAEANAVLDGLPLPAAEIDTLRSVLSGYNGVAPRALPSPASVDEAITVLRGGAYDFEGARTLAARAVSDPTALTPVEQAVVDLLWDRGVVTAEAYDLFLRYDVAQGISVTEAYENALYLAENPLEVDPQLAQDYVTWSQRPTSIGTSRQIVNQLDLPQFRDNFGVSDALAPADQQVVADVASSMYDDPRFAWQRRNTLTDDYQVVTDTTPRVPSPGTCTGQCMHIADVVAAELGEGAVRQRIDWMGARLEFDGRVLAGTRPPPGELWRNGTLEHFYVVDAQGRVWDPMSEIWAGVHEGHPGVRYDEATYRSALTLRTAEELNAAP